MKLHTLLLGFAMSGLLACGDNLEPLPEPDDGDDTGEDDGVVERVNPCLDQVSGTACSWLGIPGNDGFTPDGADRFDMNVYWTMDMLFASDGTVWFDDWNNHLVRRVMPDGKVVSVVGWTDPIFPGDGVVGSPGAERTELGAPGNDVRLNHPTDLVEAPNGDILSWPGTTTSCASSTRRPRWSASSTAPEPASWATTARPPWRCSSSPAPSRWTRTATMYIGDQQNFRVRKIDLRREHHHDRGRRRPGLRRRRRPGDRGQHQLGSRLQPGAVGQPRRRWRQALHRRHPQPPHPRRSISSPAPSRRWPAPASRG